MILKSNKGKPKNINRPIPPFPVKSNPFLEKIHSMRVNIEAYTMFCHQFFQFFSWFTKTFTIITNPKNRLMKGKRNNASK
jgi:hypothetical protein